MANLGPKHHLQSFHCERCKLCLVKKVWEGGPRGKASYSAGIRKRCFFTELPEGGERNITPSGRSTSHTQEKSHSAGATVRPRFQTTTK